MFRRSLAPVFTAEVQDLANDPVISSTTTPVPPMVAAASVLLKESIRVATISLGQELRLAQHRKYKWSVMSADVCAADCAYEVLSTFVRVDPCFSPRNACSRYDPSDPSTIPRNYPRLVRQLWATFHLVLGHIEHKREAPSKPPD